MITDEKKNLASESLNHEDLPKRVLYSTAARLGGFGLDRTSYEGALAAHNAGILAKVLAYANCQKKIAGVKDMRFNPVRFLSFLGQKDYHLAKKIVIDRVAAKLLSSGAYDLLHTWSGDALQSLLTARILGIPSVLDIPTCHVDKGERKSFELENERDGDKLRGFGRIFATLRNRRRRLLAEYALADVILTPSSYAEQTFLDVGVPKRKLFYVSRGADISGVEPVHLPKKKFRALFVGTLSRRKGVLPLLQAWRDLDLPNAELIFAGAIAKEIERRARELATKSVKFLGFVDDVGSLMSRASVFVLPSRLEGSAKAAHEAAAHGLPIVATRASGDVLKDGVNGLEVAWNDVDALQSALYRLANDGDLQARMGLASRKRAKEQFSWDMYRQRILGAYVKAKSLREAKLR